MKSRNKLLPLVVLLGLIGLLLVSTNSALGDVGGGFTPIGEGVIRLSSDSPNDFFRYDEKIGGVYVAGTVQDINHVNRCVVTTAGGAVAEMSSDSLPVGVKDHSYGLKKGGKQGTPCGQVNGPGEGSLIVIPKVEGLIDLVELDIEAKGNVTVVAEFFAEGATGPVSLGLFCAITGDATEVDCNGDGTVDELDSLTFFPTGSDSGPDAGLADNFRWRILSLGEWFELRVHPSTPGGAFGLEGGNDGTLPAPGGLGVELGGTSDTLIHMIAVDGVLDCGESATEGETGDPFATFARGENATGACQLVPYTLATGVDGNTQFVAFQPDLGNQPDAIFTARADWIPEPATLPVDPTEVDFDGESGNPSVDIQWCTGTVARVDDGDPTTIDPLATNSDGSFLDPPELPTDAPWCLLDQIVTYVGGGQMQVSEVYFGAGDPNWTRFR